MELGQSFAIDNILLLCGPMSKLCFRTMLQGMFKLKERLHTTEAQRSSKQITLQI